MIGKEDGKPMSAMADAPQKTRAQAFAETLWQELGEYTDRTSPEEWPEMCLITRDELLDFVQRAVDATAEPGPQTTALRTIVQLLGNVDHSRGGGENTARTYGGLLEDIRTIACNGLGARPEVVRALQTHDAIARARQAEVEAAERYAMGLMTEEAGELLCHIGRALRFGLDTKGQDGVTERDGMTREAGDMAAAIDWSGMGGLIQWGRQIAAREGKKAKLLDPDQRDNLGRPLAPRVPFGGAE